jgi:hypothetical protein
VVLVAALFLGAGSAAAQPRDQERPLRVGNTNLLLAGGGYASHDHPTFSTNGFFNLAYERRVLRREVRPVPLWVRGAINFYEEDRDLRDTYTYWQDPEDGLAAGPETVQEQTSDFTVRGELLADLVRSKHSALYAGGGFAMHIVNFTSYGLSSGRQGAAGLEATETRLAPSLAAGIRLFMATQPYSFYGEVRYGFTFGREEGSQDLPPGRRRPPGLADFDLESVSNVSVEGGLGLHW